MASLRPVTLITGASSGIGAALARVFAAQGHELMLVARREAELNQLADDIVATGRNRPLTVAMDLTRIDTPVRLAHELGSRGLEPDVVVNNAGYGLAGNAAGLDRAEQIAMIDLNVRALTDLSLRFTDSLVRHKGGILNVASVAGFLPGPGMAVYYASKAYVLSFSEALHYELAPAGVRVTALCPGPVVTGFQARAGSGALGRVPLFDVSPMRVAQEGYDGLKRGARIVIPGAANKVVAFLPRLLSRKAMLALSGARQRRRQRRQPHPPGWPKRPA